MEKKDELNVDKMSKEDLSRLFKVWKTLRQMMEVRGYELDKEKLDYSKWISTIKEKKNYFSP